MKYYLGNVNQFLAHKNKLEKAVQDFMKKYHRVLIKETEIVKVKKTIETAIEGLNIAYPKCTPLNPGWWTPAIDKADYKDWILGGVACVRFGFNCSKEVTNENS